MSGDLLRVGDNAFIANETNLPTPQYAHPPEPGRTASSSTNPMAPGPSLHSPYYEHMRQAYIAPLRPRAVVALKDFITDFAAGQLAELRKRAKFDAVGAGLTAGSTFCHLSGIPFGSAAAILDYVYRIMRLDPDQGGVDLGSFFVQLKHFILPPVEGRRSAGADGSNMLIDGLTGIGRSFYPSRCRRTPGADRYSGEAATQSIPSPASAIAGRAA